MNQRLAQLYDFAEDRDIQYLNKSFSNTKKAMCAQYQDKSLIVMDSEAIASDTEETELLAEELGHLETGALYAVEDYLNPNYHLNVLKAEYRARRWAIKKLIPKDELFSAIESGYIETWDLAEYFDVTEKFMIQAILYHDIYHI